MRYIWFIGLLAFSIHAQSPALMQQKCFGGSGSDVISQILATSDGGFLLFGETTSSDGDMLGQHGMYDLFVVKITSTGLVVWQRCYGGSSNDRAGKITATPDGGYVFCGYSTSTNGDVQGGHGGPFYDAWVVKINATGNIIWSNCVGGSWDDWFRDVKVNSNGDILCCGMSYSTDGLVSGNHGGGDVWVVGWAADGSVQWQNCLGGSSSDEAWWACALPNGNWRIGAESSSTDGQVIGSHGGSDVWCVTIDPQGALLSQHCYGGTGYESGRNMVTCPDGGYIFVGQTTSSNGDVIGYHGSPYNDGWVVKIDANDQIAWQHCWGGSQDDWIRSIQPTAEGGYILCGKTESNDGDVTQSIGMADVWLIKMNAFGQGQWQSNYGGLQADYGIDVLALSNGGYMVVGSVQSNNVQVSGSHGGYDVWWLQLDVDTFYTANNQTASVQIFPNPTSGSFTIQGLQAQSDRKLYIYTAQGQLLHSYAVPNPEQTLSPEWLTQGLYWIKIGENKNQTWHKLIVH